MALKKTQMIAITGGIGCGKSVVCRMLSAMGYSVYDCDSRAKTIMNADAEILYAIAHDISSDAIEHLDGRTMVNRAVLAKIVFRDPEKLSRLNAIVHTAVRRDIDRWYHRQASCQTPPDKVFVETAILHQSGVDKMVDMAWEITAPIETRIQRAMKRDGASRQQIVDRINSQSQESTDLYAISTKLIHNDGTTAILPQLIELLATPF